MAWIDGAIAGRAVARVEQLAHVLASSRTQAAVIAPRSARRLAAIRGKHRVRRRVGRGQRRKRGVWGHRAVSSRPRMQPRESAILAAARGFRTLRGLPPTGRGLPFQGFRGFQGAVRD